MSAHDVAFYASAAMIILGNLAPPRTPRPTATQAFLLIGGLVGIVASYLLK